MLNKNKRFIFSLKNNQTSKAKLKLCPIHKSPQRMVWGFWASGKEAHKTSAFRSDPLTRIQVLILTLSLISHLDSGLKKADHFSRVCYETFSVSGRFFFLIIFSGKMSSIGYSKGILEIAKFGLYVSIPIVLMYAFANNTKNIQKFMGNVLSLSLYTIDTYRHM